MVKRTNDLFYNGNTSPRISSFVSLYSSFIECLCVPVTMLREGIQKQDKTLPWRSSQSGKKKKVWQVHMTLQMR